MGDGQNPTGADIPEIPAAVVPGYILGTLILIGLVYVSYALQNTHPERFFNMLLLAAGGTSGWVAGILLSPRGQQQQRQFETLGRAIGTFISGFLLAKIAPLFEGLAGDKATWTLINGTRSLILIISFFLGLLFVFVGRTQSAAKQVSSTGP